MKIPDIDYESIMPFQVMAILLWFTKLVRGWQGVFMFTGIVFALAQFMIITRTLDRGKGLRVRYLMVQEAYCLSTILIVFTAQSGLISFD